MAEIFDRVERLMGSEALRLLRSKRVLVVGVGGVGSWCAECLIRSGIEHLTIVDSDEVAVSNINRQLQATTRTVGQKKVLALRERLLEINPDAEVTAIDALYSAETRDEILPGYDYIIDCIDSLQAKIDLIVSASSLEGVRVFSSMGAALKLDPTQIRVADFWKVEGCPLGAAMRTRMRKAHLKTGSKVLCVYSPERLANKGVVADGDGSPEAFHKVAINGSMAHITAIYGFMLAGLVIEDVNNQCL